VGTLTLFQQLRLPLKHQELKNQFVPTSVSILKPLKGADPSLEENLRSFFMINAGAPFEILFSLENRKDPAFSIVEKLIREFPEVDSRLFFSQETTAQFSELGMNPKLKNIAQSYLKAKYDVVLISDSNVRVEENLFDHLTPLLDSKTGLVTSIVAGTSFKGVGGFLEAVYLNTFYARFMALSNKYAKPCVVGKSMLFRKSTAARFGGLRIISQFLAEDFMAGESMAKLGLKIKTAVVPVSQIIGQHSFQDFWSRHLRWGRIRKAHAPLAFCFEPLSNSILICTLGSWALNHWQNTSMIFAFATSMTLWGILDWLQFNTLARTNNPELEAKAYFFPFVWLLREASAVPLWFAILSGNGVNWRGNRLNLARGGLLSEQ
jgi:ceramide glucosyltransferase